MSSGDSKNSQVGAFVDDFTERLTGWDPSASLVGLTPGELEALKDAQKVTALPAIYEQFLLRMGRGAGRFMDGTEFFFPDLLRLKGRALELLAENGRTGLLPDGAIVFSMHRGYEAYWMADCRAEDPAVECFTEGPPARVECWRSFSEYLTMELDRRIALGDRPR